MHLVVNEWLLEYSKPNAEPEERDCVKDFFDIFHKSSSKIVIGSATPFIQKYYRFAKQYGYDLEYKRFSSMLKNLFMNSSRTIIVEEEEMKHIPDEVLAGVHNDDWYLIYVALAVPDSIIISTDNRLIESLAPRNIVKIIHLRDYITGKYLQDS